MQAFWLDAAHVGVVLPTNFWVPVSQVNFTQVVQLEKLE